MNMDSLNICNNCDGYGYHKRIVDGEVIYVKCILCKGSGRNVQSELAPRDTRET
jgi:DnaJ-class molecular chaperone